MPTSTTSIMFNHTDMHDKHCSHSNDIHPIQSQNTKVAAVGRHSVSCVLALNGVNVVVVTTILVLHVGVIGHHAPYHYDFMFPRRSIMRLRAKGESEGIAPCAGAPHTHTKFYKS